MKRETEKYPYGTSLHLSETEAKENFVFFLKQYGPLTLRIGFFILLTSSSVFASDIPGPSPTPGPSPAPGNQCSPVPSPNAPKILPATKELIGIAAVGIVCAAAATYPVTLMGIAACIVTIAAKACNKL